MEDSDNNEGCAGVIMAVTMALAIVALIIYLMSVL